MRIRKFSVKTVIFIMFYNCFRGIYSNVRHLYFDGENIPEKVESLKIIPLRQ